MTTETLPVADLDVTSLIDQDHALLRQLVRRLQGTLRIGRSPDEVERARMALTAHLDAHMEFEERLMLERSYPLAFTHAQDHKAFLDQIAAVLNGLNSGTVALANLDKLLFRVHEHHVKNHDAVFCRYLTDKYSFAEVEDGSGI